MYRNLRVIGLYSLLVEEAVFDHKKSINRSIRIIGRRQTYDLIS